MALTDKLSAIAESIRGRLNTTKAMTLAEMPDLIENIGVGVIPSYWQSHLDSKVSAINSAMSVAGENKSAFLWYTDAHWKSNHGMSPMILKYLTKHTGMAKTFFGGDIAVDKTGEISSMTAWQELVKDIPNHHSVLGNHDNQVTDLPSTPSAFFIEPERTGDVVYGTDTTNGKNYYYIDNHIENTRYICLSTGRMWTYADELTWCIEALNSTPNGWHIVIISHLWLNNDYDNGGIIATPERYTQVYLDLFDAYNYRESGTTEMHSAQYNFEEAKAKVEFVIGGHVHQDYDFTTAKGIPVILTECDAWQERDDVSVVTKGTITENCVYAIIADYKAKKVKIINVGRGDTRNAIIPGVTTYTNQLRKSLTLDGSAIFGDDYNGDGTPDGYKRDTRTSSSGDTSATGWCITGLIPAKVGDVIRFKNMEYYDISGDGGSTPRTTFFVYDASFNKLTNASHNPSSPPEDKFSAVFGDNGDIIQLTVPNWNSNTAYIRICCGDLNENSIITVNEEIDMPEMDDEGNVPSADYENVLTTAIDFDGTVLDGVGYRDNVRLSTSGNAFSGTTGWDCTGLIPCKRGDVIRMKNVTMYYSADYNTANGDRGRVAYRKANYDNINQTKLNEFDAMNPVYDNSGNIVQFTVPTWESLAEIEYIIICAQDINADSIITVNKEIE